MAIVKKLKQHPPLPPSMYEVGIYCRVSTASKGFTLAELLIVVAIIAVLVAVAIPLFTSQLERAREATDAANIRSVYAELMTAAITDDKNSALWAGTLWKSEEQTLKQKQDGWSSSDISVSLGTLGTQDGIPVSGGSFWVSYDPNVAVDINPVTINYSTGMSGGSTPALSVSQQINEKLEVDKIMTTYKTYANGKWTGAKTAVSSVNVFNNTDTGNKFTQTLKDVIGDVFTYQVAQETLSDGTRVRYVYITTDGTYDKNSTGPSGIKTVRYTYLYSSGHTSEKTTELLNTEYGTASWTKKYGFTDFTID